MGGRGRDTHKQIQTQAYKVISTKENKRIIKDMAIKVFYHICAINHVMTVVKTHVMMMHMSGLYDSADAIYCCICGDPPLIQEVTEFLTTAGKKFVIHKVAPNDKSYERLTLYAMHDLLTTDDYALYFHSKSVSRLYPEQMSNVEDWVRMLSYHVIKRHEKSVQLLRSGYDVVGCNYHNANGGCPWHFSGNFWWVRGEYYLSLPRYIGPNYCDPEFYVCSKYHRGYSLFNSDVDHHHTPFKLEKYVDP